MFILAYFSNSRVINKAIYLDLSLGDNETDCRNREWTLDRLFIGQKGHFLFEVVQGSDSFIKLHPSWDT